MSEDMHVLNIMGFEETRSTKPCDVEGNDAFAIKVVAVMDPARLTWAAYVGPTEWSDEKVAHSGVKLLEEQALPLFYVLRESGVPYRR